MKRREMMQGVAAATCASLLPVGTVAAESVGIIPVLFDVHCKRGGVWIIAGHAYAHPSERDGELLQGRDWIHGRIGSES
jgi:hypothetical protein